MMQIDYGTIAITGFICLYGAIYIIRHRRKLSPNEPSSLRLILAGVVLLILAIVFNNFIEEVWHFDYVIDFLSLKDVGRWAFRVIASMSYAFLIWGIVMYIVVNARPKDE